MIGSGRPNGDGHPRRWLVKEEPTHYAFADLVRDGSTDWDQVHNPLAQRNLRSMRPGDPVVFYHTGEERAAVGLATVAGVPEPDPEDPRGAWKVRVSAKHALTRPVELERLKL